MTTVSADQPQLGPVQSQERVILLDVLRAFAILGMFYANYAAWNQGLTVAIYGSGIQSLANAAMDVLVNSKFRMLFGLLMGVGMAVCVRYAVLFEEKVEA